MAKTEEKSIEQQELERLLSAKDLSFTEICNLISLLENYPSTLKFCVAFLQHRLKVAMTFGDKE